MPRKMKTTLDDVAEAFGFGCSVKSDSHLHGIVRSVNADGSIQVSLNESGATARCAALASVGAKAGDRVLVLRMSNGRCTVLGKF